MNSFKKRQRAQTAAAVVGVDAGKFRHALVIRSRGGEDSKPFTFTVTREGFDAAAQQIHRAVPGAKPQSILVGIEFAGVYGFTLAYYLNQQGFQIVSVLPAHTKRWKEVMHHQALKTDQKDAETITDLVSQGQFVTFPFLEPAYAELRYLVSARERVSMLRSAAVTRLKSALHIVFPEFESVFQRVDKPTAMAVLQAFPGPEDLLSAPRHKVLRVLKTASRNHLGMDTYGRLITAAKATLALPGAQGALKEEVRLLLEQIKLHQHQMDTLKARMVEAMQALPEAEYLLSIPGVAHVSAAIFLGCVGDPKAYESSRQILKLAGLTLVEHSSGTHKGQQRISKRGRPVMRRQAFMLALASVRGDGLFRQEFEALVARNGGRKVPAIVAISRKFLRLMFSVAKERRHYTIESPRQEARTEVAG